VRGRPARIAVAAGAAVGLVASGAACNAILGNEERFLDDRDGGAPGADVGDEASTADAPACIADLSRDPRHCGACGHDCLAGACEEGICQPFVLATDLPQPAHLVVEGGVLYWTNGDGTVRSCPTAGCNGAPKIVMTVVTGNPSLSGIAVSGGTVFVSGYYSQQIHTCPVEGCSRPTSLASNLQYPVSVKVDGVNAFWIDADRASVARCPLPSCAGGPITLATGPAAWRSLSLDDQRAYWLAAGPVPNYSRAILYRADKDQIDGGPAKVADELPGATGILVKGSTLYMTLDGPLPDSGLPRDGRVVKLALRTNLQFPLATGQGQPRGLALDEINVYWTTWGDGSIRRCAIAGCNDEPTTLVTGQNQPVGPAVTGDAIYWTENLGGTLKGLAK
jgi:hypothetical protein